VAAPQLDAVHGATSSSGCSGCPLHPTPSPRLGVNIDHVATVRNARGGPHPDPVRAAHLAIEAGADGITAHLREDRRHIRDEDMERLRAEISVPLNFEMAVTDEMVALATRLRPHAACLVPRSARSAPPRAGSISVRARISKDAIARLNDAGCRVSLFVEPDERVMDAARALGAPVVELHTGTYAEAWLAGDTTRVEAERRGSPGPRARRVDRARDPCGPRADDAKCRADRRDPADRRAEYRALSHRRGDLRRARPRHRGHARGDGCCSRGRNGTRMIIGIGSDLCDIRRIEKTIARHGERFTHRVFTQQERERSEARRHSRPLLCKALRRQGGLRQGARHRHGRRRVLARHGGRQRCRRTADLAAHGRRGARLAMLLPRAHEAVVHVSLTDDPPLAQAFVVIEARPVLARGA
jgi:pyridoxine 5'-phosphate synthase